MTYTETAIELNRLAKKLYETEFLCDPTTELREILKYKMLRTSEELMKYIDNAVQFTLISEYKKDIDGKIIGQYYKSIIYRSKSYKKVYEIRFILK